MKSKTINNIYICELTPALNSHQKSFYNKAKLYYPLNENFVILQSYSTYVCKIIGTGSEQKFVRLWNGYSATTLRHINALRKIHGFKALSKKEWEALPVC